MTATMPIAARGSWAPERLLAALAVVAAIVLFAAHEQVRRAEATVCAAFIRLFSSMPADTMGTAVVFPIDRRYVGFTVAPSCTAALLIAPFFILTGVLLLVRRVPPARALSTVAAFGTVVFVVNQLRLLMIVLSIRVWGWPAGFEHSHVLLGTVVSTVGVAGGLLLFLRMVVPRSKGPARA